MDAAAGSETNEESRPALIYQGLRMSFRPHIARAVPYVAHMTSDHNQELQPPLHLVLVPGFGGFDALGQVEYYAGTTQVFQAWLREHSPERRISLHYFGGLPTAGVRTRATYLKQYLIKLLRRRQIHPGEEIALIGHSTGGLDIRALLLDLAQNEDNRLWVDGIEDKKGIVPGQQSAPSTGADLLGMISHLVFLSVPQRGTNIANWVRSYPALRESVVNLAHTLIDELDSPAANVLRRLAARVPPRLGASLTRLNGDIAPHLSATTAKLKKRGIEIPDVFEAVRDALADVLQRDSPDAVKAAGGRAALADLALWFSETQGDFLAINDLSCTEEDVGPLRRMVGGLMNQLVVNRARKEDDVTRLARSSDEDRRRELEIWSEYAIASRSYATVGRPPFDVDVSTQHQPRSIKEVATRALAFLGDTRSDATYRAAYAACSTGPFADVMREARATRFGKPGELRTLQAWENDGIVNTASMLWPHGESTILLEGDHGDIIGHYRKTPVDSPTNACESQKPPVGEPIVSRKYWSYDFFGSESGFTEQTFNDVWSEVFSFCSDGRVGRDEHAM